MLGRPPALRVQLTSLLRWRAPWPADPSPSAIARRATAEAPERSEGAPRRHRFGEPASARWAMAGSLRVETQFPAPPRHGWPASRSSAAQRMSEGWCPRRDSNPHAVRHRLLKPACLPVPPPGQALLCHEARPRRAAHPRKGAQVGARRNRPQAESHPHCWLPPPYPSDRLANRCEGRQGTVQIWIPTPEKKGQVNRTSPAKPPRNAD